MYRGGLSSALRPYKGRLIYHLLILRVLAALGAFFQGVPSPLFLFAFYYTIDTPRQLFCWDAYLYCLFGCNPATLFSRKRLRIIMIFVPRGTRHSLKHCNATHILSAIPTIAT